MKKFFILSALVVSINGYAQVQLFNGSEYSRIPTGKEIDPTMIDAQQRDTVCEWMHLSISQRHNSIVLLRKALSVQINGKCIQHLYANRRKFPIHYHVGWCEGKEKLFNRLIVN